jgi:hypothetical protein
MATDERVARGLEPLLEQIEQKEAELTKLKEAANLYATTLGADAPFPGVTDASRGRRDVIRPDQFARHGAPSAATRAYLEWRGETRGAATIDEIYDALYRGGFSFENRNAEDAKSGLRVALGKDSLVHRLANGYYGLASWYGVAAPRKKSPRERKENGEVASSTPTPPEVEEAAHDASE